MSNPYKLFWFFTIYIAQKYVHGVYQNKTQNKLSLCQEVLTVRVNQPLFFRFIRMQTEA